MPRLLLVDDNPSIHRIAESLLASTDVELVCVDSAAEALDRIGRGEHFDVALVDTAMPGMDGWDLLTRLRDMDATARMPIALMAGVLDPVDPMKLAQAPVQGFLKKPIELRELAVRVKTLLATPVQPMPSPVAPSSFSTIPGTPVNDLLRRAEGPFPEFRAEPVREPVRPFAGATEPESDLLLLTEGDLWPEESVEAPFASDLLGSAASDVRLEFEGLDLDSLQDLSPLTQPATNWMTSTPEPEEEPSRSSEGPSPEPRNEDVFAAFSGMDDLSSIRPGIPLPRASAGLSGSDMVTPFPPLPTVASPFDWNLQNAQAAQSLPEVTPFNPSRSGAHEPARPIESQPTPTYDAGGQGPAPSGQGAMSVEQARALVQALTDDPALLDSLVKILATRMGDQVLREVAWEVIPDLAGRLQR